MDETLRKGVVPVYGKLLLLAFICGLIALFYYYDLMQFLNLQYLTERRDALHDYYHAYPYKSAAIFFLTHVTLAGLSLPVSALMMVASGAIFGLYWGTIIAAFAAVTGSTIAFLYSRYLLKDIVRERYAKKLETINNEMETDGTYYLFMLRLTPLFPSFLISILLGVTFISVTRFYLISLIGMLPGTLIAANAGTQIANINTMSDIFSAPLLGALALVGIFPLLVRKIMSLVNRRKNQPAK